jgi:hypothetical protein
LKKRQEVEVKEEDQEKRAPSQEDERDGPQDLEFYPTNFSTQA